MSMTRQEQLDAVVRNYGEWPVGESLKFAAYNERDSDVLFFGSPHAETLGFELFTRSEVEARKAELQNKPRWGRLPAEANFIAQNSEGSWDWFAEKPTPEHDDGYWCADCADGFTFRSGEVIGDWRDTLEKRPDEDCMRCIDRKTLPSMGFDIKRNQASEEDQPTPEEEDAFKMIEARNGERIDSSEGEVMSQSNSDLYPQYFKDVSGIDKIDVYAVHQLFAVDDPSGAIQHASKKLLLSGVRTGGKSKYKDIKEARDTLSRWLELNNE